MECGLKRPVGEHDFKLFVQNNDTLCTLIQCRVQKFRRSLLLQHPFNTESRRHHQSQRMRVLLSVIITGQINASHQFTVHPVNRRCGTGPPVLHPAEMLCTHGLNRCIIIQRNSDGIAADLKVTPQCANLEIQDILHLIRQRVPHRFQNVSHTVRQYEEKAAVIDNIVYTLHDGNGDIDQFPVFIQNTPEHILVDYLSLPRIMAGTRRPAFFPGSGDDRIQPWINLSRLDIPIPVPFLSEELFLYCLSETPSVLLCHHDIRPPSHDFRLPFCEEAEIGFPVAFSHSKNLCIFNYTICTVFLNRTFSNSQKSVFSMSRCNPNRSILKIR